MTSDTTHQIPVLPEEFADQLNLLLADVVWALARDNDPQPSAKLTAALNKWQEHPLVSRAAVLACDAASFPSWGFESLWRALVRAAYHTWRRDLDRTARIDLLSRRARDENDDGSSPVAAELLNTAIALREEWEVDGPTEGLPAIADLLWQLLRALEEYGSAGPTDHARVMTQGAHAGRRLVAIYSQLVETDRAAHLSSLAEAITTSAGFIAWVDGPLAGADQSERGVLLFEELADSFTSRGFRRLSRAWSEHIALLDRAGFASRAREWERHRTEKLRILAAAGSAVGADAMALLGLRSLARLLNSHDLHAETVSLSAHMVTLAEAAAVDHATVTNLADIVRQHGIYLHRAGQRAEAMATWHRCVEVQRRLIGTSADIDGTVVADAYHTIVQQAEKIGDRSAAIEFGGRAIDELSRSAELDRVTHLPHLVDKLRAQARRLDNAGRRDEAVEVAEQSVARAQDLLILDPEQYRPNLSWALTCAAGVHFGSRRAEAADLRSRQALDLIEDLAQTGEYTAALANALHNRALALNLRDDYALSMESSARAATLYEELAAGKAVHRASWANVLCTRAISAENLRDFDTALDCVTKAQEIYSQLAERNPAKYSGDLAYVLNRLASIHQSMGSAQVTALAAGSLEICAALPEGRERDDLQTSALNALIRNLTGTGQPREALAHSTVLLEVQERMVARDPAETVDLVIALGNHSLCLSQLGREHEALEYACRAVDLVRPPAESEPGPHLAPMASALGRYANQLAETGQADRAVEVSAEAVACYEQLLTDHRDLHLRSAAMCLDNYALWLDRVGHTEEGFAAAARSLAMFEELLERGGDRADLGTCLLNHANRLQHQERNTEALGYATRALELFEELAPENPGAHAPNLARALHLQSTALDGLGRHDEALPPQQRAVRICAARAAHDRQLNLTFLAKTTCGLGQRLAHAGQWPQARDQLRTGVRLWEELTELDTRLHLDGLAAALGTNARFCLDHDEWDEAAAYFERAATAYEELVARDPRAHLADLGWAVENHAYALQKLGRRRRASAQADRALSIWRRTVAEFPAEFLPRLAAGEAWAARFRLDNNEFDRAAGHMERGVRHYCSLIDAGRDDLVVNLEIALHRYARTLHQVRLCAWAAAAMEDVVYLARQLFETDAAQHHFRLADTLRDQAWLYSDAGRRRDAVDAGREALDVLTDLIASDDEDRRSTLADYLDSQADSLAEVGQLTECLELNARAVALWEQLAIERETTAVDLAWSLWHRARWLAERDGDVATLPISQRAIEILQRTSENRPGDVKYLADALVDHGLHLARAGWHTQTLDHNSRALVLWEALAADKPREHIPGLAGCLRRRATHLAESFDIEAALETSSRAIELTAQATEWTRRRHLPDLAACCHEAALLWRDRDSGQARTLAVRAVGLYAESARQEPGIFDDRLAQARTTAALIENDDRP